MKKNTPVNEEEPTLYETENDLPKPARIALNQLMNQRLADAIDLQSQIKQAHWNVKGPNFIGLHKLFDEVDEAVESYVDLIAETHRATRRHCRRHGARGRVTNAAPGVSSQYRGWHGSCRGGGPRPFYLRRGSPRHD